MAKHQGMRSCEVGKTVASGMRDLQFESHHQMLHLPTSALHCSEMIKIKRKRVQRWHQHFKNRIS